MQNFESSRILITRLSHIGDCILTLPMMNAIRHAMPNAFIAWAVESPSNQFLKNQDGIDQVIVVPKGWMGKPTTWRGVARELRSYEFDIAIDPQGITKSATLGWLSGARKRIGIAGRWGRELSTKMNNCLVQTRRNHIVDRSMELLAPLGISACSSEFRFRQCPKAKKDMHNF